MLNHPPSLHLRALVLLGITLSFPQGSMANPNIHIGRYEARPKGCTYINSTQDTLTCSNLQFNGRSASVVGISFIGKGQSKNARRQITFVTLTTKGQPLLKCNVGKCHLNVSSWQSTVSSVAEASFNPNGIATGIPKSWFVNQGECNLKDKILKCSAQQINGKLFTAEAQL